MVSPPSAGLLFQVTDYSTRVRSYIVIICIPWLFISCINRVNPPPVARQGELDLSAWNFQKDGNLPLEGEWEFYWDRLLTPADFKNRTQPLPTGFAMVTGEWNSQVIGNRKFPGQGYATYRLRVKK